MFITMMIFNFLSVSASAKRKREGGKAATAQQENHRKSELVGSHDLLFLLALCKACSLYREKEGILKRRSQCSSRNLPGGRPRSSAA
jgi:hypothetical protein